MRATMANASGPAALGRQSALGVARIRTLFRAQAQTLPPEYMRFVAAKIREAQS